MKEDMNPNFKDRAIWRAIKKYFLILDDILGQTTCYLWISKSYEMGSLKI